MSKFLAALISIAIIASTLTSTAEAFPGRRIGFFLGGMAAGAMMGHAIEERRREEAYDRARARRMAAARERAAQQRAAAAAAAKRARLIALKKQQAAQVAAANATPPAPAADTSAPALKKGDRLPSADTTAVSDASETATTVEKTPFTGVVTNAADAADTDAVCRRYSAATDSLVDTPCR